MKLLENLNVKQKQRLLLFTALVGIMIIAMTAIYMTSQEKPDRYEEHKKKKMSLLTEKVEKDLWVAAEGQNIKAIEKSVEALQQDISSIKSNVEDLRKKGTVKEDKKVSFPPGVPPIPSSVGTQSPQPPAGAVVPPMPPATPNVNPTPQPITPVRGSKQQDGITGSGSMKFFQDEQNKNEEAAKSKKTSLKEQSWLSAGTFMKARLLNGIDAPTSGGSQSEPYPVLLHVSDLGQMPNRYKANLRECVVIGAGYGNVSDERAYVRLETLSCIKKDGKAIEVPLRGHVVGEDGKLGMRGRLVSKQGSHIAMSIFAGTLGGLGKALQPQQALQLNINPDGQRGVVQPNIGEVIGGSALGGGGSALDKVAQHYLKMAEKIFPIIEIDAGREIELIILKGEALTKPS